jgi:hypothetical protein
MVVRNEPHPDHELFDGQCRKHRAKAALKVIRFEHAPHPVEFDMY